MLKIANQTHYHKLAARQLVEQVHKMILQQDMVLAISDSDIKLCSLINRQRTCYSHSFTNPALIRRALQKNQALLKACNNKNKQIESVWDLTAGWGKDSFILASQGQKVSMVEQNQLLASCLNYLLYIMQKEQVGKSLQKMEIYHQNSLEFLIHHRQLAADCLYLDPMFPAHKSSAKPSSDLQLLQLLTENQDIEALFENALEVARHRVVVKRPLHAPTLNSIKPDIVYKEKTIRFDVYLTQNS
jgi:16S rRNA (guanine1516-N2)-methyltransferase